MVERAFQVLDERQWGPVAGSVGNGASFDAEDDIGWARQLIEPGLGEFGADAPDEPCRGRGVSSDPPERRRPDTGRRCADEELRIGLGGEHRVALDLDVAFGRLPSGHDDVGAAAAEHVDQPLRRLGARHVFTCVDGWRCSRRCYRHLADIR